MAPRASWKGYLKLSLVSCSVSMFPATTTADRIHFNILNRATGNRVRYEVVDAETGEPVEKDDRVKGYAVAGRNYVLLEDDELDQVALESTHTLDIESFVDRAEVDGLFLDESHYLVPGDDVGLEAFAVIRKAMEKENLVGLARVVLHRRERLLMLQPRGRGLLATALRYRNEVRDESDYLDDIPNTRVPGDMLDLAVHILKSKVGTFAPDTFEDRYETALKKLIAAKRAGKELPSAPEPKESNVIDLMEALRRSVKGGASSRKEASGASRSPAKPARKAAARKTPARKTARKKLKRAS